MRESLKDLHMSSTLIVTSQCIVMLDDVISSDKLVIHRNEVVNINVYQVVIGQVIDYAISATDLSISLLITKVMAREP